MRLGANTKPTKTEIRTYVLRASKATKAINNLLDNERRWLAEGSWTREEIDSRLQDWAEELSGCGGEVQTLLSQRYGFDL